MIEVAIGEYGTDILTKLADSTLNTYRKTPHRPSNTISIGPHDALLLENGKLPIQTSPDF